MAPVPHVFARLQRLAVLTAVVVFAISAAVAFGTGKAGAARVIVLGAATPATPACPENCTATGKTTGFQTRIGKMNKPFVARVPGRVVAWSIKLSKPSQKQIDFFGDLFGGAPQAGISILKPIRKAIKRGRPLYKLKAKSPVENLAPFYGTTTTFTLQKPLPLAKGHIVALTIPTWAPAFAIGQSSRTGWRASRKSTRCGLTNNEDKNAQQLKQGRPHLALGSERIYGCAYKTARLLYSATMVQRPAG